MTGEGRPLKLRLLALFRSVPLRYPEFLNAGIHYRERSILLCRAWFRCRGVFDPASGRKGSLEGFVYFILHSAIRPLKFR